MERTVKKPMFKNKTLTAVIIFILAAGLILAGFFVQSKAENIRIESRNDIRIETVYAAPEGKDTNSGDYNSPLDIISAFNIIKPGQTLVLKGGIYNVPSALTIPKGHNGTAQEPIKVVADLASNLRPVLDFSGSGSGLICHADYWYFEGFDVANAPPESKGFLISGNYNVLNRINSYNNGETGIQISGNTFETIEKWPSYNYILNCTSYNNADPDFGDADGFAAKITSGEGNVFDGCIAYNNSDDGFDLYSKPATGTIGKVIIKNCIAYKNGFLADGRISSGNGNGFKMGGSSMPGNHELINSLAFDNKAKGIDSNSCPDIYVKNCTSFNNTSYNVAYYTNVGGVVTNYRARGIISFKTTSTKNENFKPQNQNESDYWGLNNFYWFNGQSSNKNELGNNTEITADMFSSLEFNYEQGFLRYSNGRINAQGFMQLTNEAISYLDSMSITAGAKFTKDKTSSDDGLDDNDFPKYILPELTIEVISTAELNSEVTIKYTVSSDCTVTITVMRNSEELIEVFDNKFILDKDGEYLITVTARNNITGITNAKTSVITIPPLPVSSKGLSAWAITGIVLGSVAFAAVAGFAIYWFILRKTR